MIKTRSFVTIACFAVVALLGSDALAAPYELTCSHTDSAGTSVTMGSFTSAATTLGADALATEVFKEFTADIARLGVGKVGCIIRDTGKKDNPVVGGSGMEIITTRAGGYSWAKAYLNWD